ncbi:MAG: RIP metalloprotease RseP [Eubacteriales bacterium]|nr:RIP metalloprotease RseP [Eubacteriales bacterium]
MKFIVAIIIFSVIVIIHELGHFLFAKKNGICVEEFAVGIGPTLFGIQKGETKYSIKALPFGGCCMMLGEDGESNDPRAFGSKSAAARFSVIFAGPFFNFILAFLLALVSIGIGGADPSIIGTVEEGSGAYEAGIQPGDKILKLDGSRVYNFREITLFNLMHSEKADVEVAYERDGQKYETTVVRKQGENGNYLFGITMTKDYKQNLLGVLKYSILEVRYQIKSTFSSLKYLITGKASFNDMSGPVGIVNMVGDVYEESISYGILTAFLSMLEFSILLTANLGVMNLLPIPALDGGRIVFILIEMIRGKKMDPDKEGMVHLVGLVLLLILMVVIMGNDIRKIFFV